VQSSRLALPVESKPTWRNTNKRLSGDGQYAILRFPVTEAVYNQIHDYINNFGAFNPTYILGPVDCVHAAFAALDSGGQTNGWLSHYPAVSPTNVYSLIRQFPNAESWRPSTH